MSIFSLKSPNKHHQKNPSQAVDNRCFRMNSQYHPKLLPCKRKILCT